MKENAKELTSLLIKTELFSDIGEDKLRKSIDPIAQSMANTAQDPAYHGEGDVLTHTLMTCRALIESSEYQAQDSSGKRILLLAAVLHDIGKTVTTVAVNGSIQSPHHSAKGELMARELMWRGLGMCGSKEAQREREAISLLIRYHSVPPFVMKDADPTRRLITIAANGSLTDAFSLRRLCILEKADALGRLSRDKNDYYERVEYAEMLSDELKILDTPHSFSSDYTARAYFKGKTDLIHGELYRDSFGEVIMLCGLPASGKDTFIKKYYPAHPTVSLDDIRAELRISPTEDQGRVIAAAHERARFLLRRRTPFVWNATSLTRDIRKKQIDLFEDYGASVKTVFLECEWNEELRRNSERNAEVPYAVIERMLSRFKPPERQECESVVWTIG